MYTRSWVFYSSLKSPKSNIILFPSKKSRKLVPSALRDEFYDFTGAFD